MKVEALDKQLAEALALHRAGRLKEAEAIYAAILEHAPTHIDTLGLLGTLYVQTGRFREAIGCFDHFLAQRPNTSLILVNRGAALQGLGRHDEALASYDKTISLTSDYTEAWCGRGQALTSLGRDMEALASYERALALHPDFPAAMKSRANLLRRLHRPEQALIASEQAIAALPTEADSYTNRSLVLSELVYDQPNLVLDHLERYSLHRGGGRNTVSATAFAREEYARFFGHCVTNRAWTAAQSFQDLFVRYVLGKTHGFFVEFGAADGVLTSNTWALERDFAWAGILAEPARTWHQSLKANRRCAIDTRCVWNRSGEQIEFNETAMPLLSTIATFSEADGHAKRRKDGTRYAVETVSLNDLLMQHGAPKVIDYLSVDTEGSECEIIESLDFSRYEIGVLTVEHNFHWGNRNRLHAFLTAKGYVRRFEALLLQDDWYVKA